MHHIGLAMAVALAFFIHPKSMRAEPTETPRRQEIGISGGHGFGVKFAGSGLGDGHEVETLVLLPHWQIEIWRSSAPSGTSGRPRLDLRVEGTALINFAPTTGYALGGGIFLRHHFADEARLSPFLHAGAGILALEFGLQDQADGLAFNPQAGVGLRWRWSPEVNVDFELRFQHISNAYTASPNRGIDSLQFLVGVSKRIEHRPHGD
ncbi:acyloxyacyl hydrolase [Myxococcota bacterium]|nr:acyloxyacyl hydrolase [Myxococcota bacterium]